MCIMAHPCHCCSPLFSGWGSPAFGGPAMITYIRKMAVGEKKWLDGESFQDGVALCQTIPGATAMQMAAYVGLKAMGVAGAAASYLGFGFPAFLLMLALSFVYSRMHELPAVVSAFSGLQAVIVVKNSILLIDFIEIAKEKGMPTIDALKESVRVRTRPILMTAFGTAVGMVPIALERAIGLERLSPLAVVAIGGLMVSTFLTLLYVPIFYTLFEDAVQGIRKILTLLTRV